MIQSIVSINYSCSPNHSRQRQWSVLRPAIHSGVVPSSFFRTSEVKCGRKKRKSGEHNGMEAVSLFLDDILSPCILSGARWSLLLQHRRQGADMPAPSINFCAFPHWGEGRDMSALSLQCWSINSHHVTVFCICIPVFKKEDGDYPEDEDDPEEWDDPEDPGEDPGILLPVPLSHPEVRFNEA